MLSPAPDVWNRLILTPLPQGAYSAARLMEIERFFFFSRCVSVPSVPLAMTRRMSVAIFILNFNGRPLLAQCLPTVLRAAAASRHACRVVVIDNDSRDDSRAWLAAEYPNVEIVCCPNDGLCSFNRVLADSVEPVAILLNNDIKLAAGAIDPLVAPLLVAPSEGQPELLLTAPLCWRFDGRTYEGFRTAVRWRWGLVQATALYAGHEPSRLQPGLTASAGAALAVDRLKFLALDGFDRLYLPGRLEDLDLAFRGYLAGYRALYVPESVAFHRGEATFAATCGADGSTRLALRNTLLFQWKNLRDPWHIFRHLAALPIRLAYDACRAPWRPASARFMFWQAFLGAIRKLPESRALRRQTLPALTAQAAEREFFRRFAPLRMAMRTSASRNQTAANRPVGAIACEGANR